MTGSVARHCEPTHNWTLDSGLRCHRTCVRSTQDRRRGEPPLLNGPVTSRMISTAVVNEGLRHRLCTAPAGPFRQSVPDPLFTTPDAACRILCNRRIVRQSADRCLKQHPGELRPYGRDPTADFSPEIQATANPRYPDSPPVNKGSRSSTIAGKIHPSKNLQSFTAEPVRTA